MKTKEFNKIVDHTITEIQKLVSYKGGIYANEENRLHNFDRTAEIKQETPLKACHGMWSKQLVSLLDAIDHHNEGEQSWSQDRCEEVINDLLVYLILTKALFYRACGWDIQKRDE